MIRQLASALLGVALFVGCGVGRPAAYPVAQRPSPVGGPCGNSSECQDGLYCDKSDPDGECLRSCAASADCGAGALCSDDKRCHRACRGDADCERPGYECRGPAPSPFCVASEEENQKAIERAIEQGRMYGL